MEKKIALYEVRNLQGEFIGTWFAPNPHQAVTKALDANAAHFATFKGSNGLKRDHLVAVVRAAKIGDLIDAKKP